MARQHAGVDSPLRTLLVAGAVSLVCAALVSASSVLLRPLQEANREADRQRHIRALAARLPGVEALLVGEAPPEIETHVIELATGNPARGIDPAICNPRTAVLDPQWSVELTPAQDVASIQRRAKYALVHLLHHEGALRLIILPVHGSGYDSTLYGFLALEGDANTVVALSFFEHEETPGLGAEIDSEDWRAQWRGKQVRDAQGRLRIGVASGRVAPDSPDAPYQVDGIAGATATSEGVSNLLRFWLGEDGYGPFLSAIRAGGGP
ncbi:MAG: Na(+)-translocating NADH-quinone reductase subunit C [Planctomycetota bacterium]|jgi:Na+-transporting NADH:ubiquinone oxidoreductase subunit C